MLSPMVSKNNLKELFNSVLLDFCALLYENNVLRSEMFILAYQYILNIFVKY